MSRLSDVKIKAEWNNILRLQRKGTSLSMRLAGVLADLLEKEGVTDEDIDRLFPPEPIPLSNNLSALADLDASKNILVDGVDLTGGVILDGVDLSKEVRDVAPIERVDMRPWAQRPERFDDPSLISPTWIAIFKSGVNRVAFRPTVCWSRNQVYRKFGQQVGFLGAFNLAWLYSLAVADNQDGWPKGELPNHTDDGDEERI